MTTKKDNFSLRESKLSEARELSEGVPLDGFQDPTGALPKRDYNFDVSINKASRGTQVNNLYVGGGEFGVPLGITPQRPSQYPCNQVNETTSGHVVEYDDTPGGERILIKHRKGAGVEMRADGSVIISAVKNKVEVTGGDQTVIIEGNGNLVYHGNLNLKVSGDYNVDVGGNYNVNVAGNKIENIFDNHHTTVTGNSVYTTKESRTTRTIGTHTDVMLSDNNQIVKGNQENLVEGDIKIASESDIFMSGKESLVATSKATNITGAKQVSIFGNKGNIGGKEVDFTGKSFHGSKGAIEAASNAIFYGTFKGVATEALRSVNADKANQAKSAFQALKAGTAGALGASGTATDPTVVATSLSQESITGQNKPITPDLVVDHSTNGSYAIRSVSIDAGDRIKNALIFTDDYDDVFKTRPTTQEIRSAFRNPDAQTCANTLVAEERLNRDYKSKVPPAIGRTSKKKATARFGYTPLGNSTVNRGKRFAP